jgi:hypothetical protein
MKMEGERILKTIGPRQRAVGWPADVVFLQVEAAVSQSLSHSAANTGSQHAGTPGVSFLSHPF